MDWGYAGVTSAEAPSVSQPMMASPTASLNACHAIVSAWPGSSALTVIAMFTRMKSRSRQVMPSTRGPLTAALCCLARPRLQRSTAAVSVCGQALVAPAATARQTAAGIPAITSIRTVATFRPAHKAAVEQKTAFPASFKEVGPLHAHSE